MSPFLTWGEEGRGKEGGGGMTFLIVKYYIKLDMNFRIKKWLMQ